MPNTASTAIVERKLLEHKVAIGVLCVLAALAIAMAVIGHSVTSAGLERVSESARSQGKTISSLDARISALSTTATRRLDEMHASMSEVQYPPSGFSEAQDLFKDGRYAEAESAYRSFLLRSPNSRLADKALRNAAVAASISNDCTMADSYVKRLNTQFPLSPLTAGTKDLPFACRKLRTTHGSVAPDHMPIPTSAKHSAKR